MEMKGYILQVMDERGGVSSRTGNSWRIKSYVLETVEQYPRHLAFDVKNDNIDKFNLQKGEEVMVSFDIDANEYQGKWYNKVTAWKVEKTGDIVQVTRTSANTNNNTNANTNAVPQQPSLYAKAQQAVATTQAQQAQAQQSMQQMQQMFDAHPEGSDVPF